MNEEAIIITCECGHAYRISPEHFGRRARCQTCGTALAIPPLATTQEPRRSTPPPMPARPSTSSHTQRCPVCQCGIEANEATTSCPGCAARYHVECWDENGGCGVYGCSNTPAVEARTALEIPTSYWGSEKKQCPSCDTTIQAAAKRCRNCGAEFSSARPEDTIAFNSRQNLAQNLPKLRRKSIWLLVFSFLPITAPIAFPLGFLWYRRHRKDFAELPTIHGALCKLALGVAGGQSLIAVLVALLFTVKNAL